MNTLTYERAKLELKKLEQYIYLIETYEIDSIDKWVLKEYAYTITGVIKSAEEQGVTNNGVPLDRKYISKLLTSKPKDELHTILQKFYKKKTKPNRRFNTSVYKN